LIKKVVFMGAPSTGKTTSVIAAAKHFNTQYVLEYGREYWEKNQTNRLLTPEQLLFIAQEQIRQEDAAIEKCNTFLFVDTNALTTWHFAQDYHGSALPELSVLAEQSKERFDYVFLCGDEIPYEDTWERSGDVKRHEFQEFITKELNGRGITYTKLSGSVEARLQTMIQVLSAQNNDDISIKQDGNSPMKDNKQQANNPLHGVKLEQIVVKLHEQYGWDGLADRININCFKSDPSVKSSLKFLRRTPWAREKVETLFLRTFN
jgi:NadR type nicotinamide-nucleotide adenylyltransferase